MRVAEKSISGSFLLNIFSCRCLILFRSYVHMCKRCITPSNHNKRKSWNLIRSTHHLKNFLETKLTKINFFPKNVILILKQLYWLRSSKMMSNLRFHQIFPMKWMYLCFTVSEPTQGIKTIVYYAYTILNCRSTRLDQIKQQFMHCSPVLSINYLMLYLVSSAWCARGHMRLYQLGIAVVVP